MRIALKIIVGILKVLFLIVLAPVLLTLMLVVQISKFILAVVGGLLIFISVILSALGVVTLIFALVEYHGHLSLNVALAFVVVFGIAFLASPFGLPKLAVYLVVAIAFLTELIKSLYSIRFVRGY